MSDASSSAAGLDAVSASAAGFGAASASATGASAVGASAASVSADSVGVASASTTNNSGVDLSGIAARKLDATDGESVLDPQTIPTIRLRSRDEWARAKETEGVVCQTHVGGQALIEGIMMRGKYNWAVAVREPSGNIYVEEHDLVSGVPKNSWLHKPVVRGCTAMVESLALGYKALDIASQHAFDLSDEDERAAVEDAAADTECAALEDAAADAEHADVKCAAVEDAAADAKRAVAEETAANTERAVAEDAVSENPDEEEPAIPKALITGAMVLGLVLGVVIFVVLPALLTNLIVGDYAEKTLLWNIVDGVIRVAIFVFYIWLIGRMKDIKRMFAYHGAEHKTIHCYEHGLELTVENARQFPTLHVRCGTAFMLTTMLIAILVFTIAPIGPLIDAMGVQNDILRLTLVILSRIILLPVVAGLSYELTVKWAGSRPKSPLVQFVLWPGMQMQRLTTNPPDDGMLECAIAAVKRVLEREELENAKKLVKVEPAPTTAEVK